MLLVWPENTLSPIHDHGGSECWLRVIDGPLVEKFYELPESTDKPGCPLKLKFSKSCDSGGVCFINDNRGLHAIGNESKDKIGVSLHCYVPGLYVCLSLCVYVSVCVVFFLNKKINNFVFACVCLFENCRYCSRSCFFFCTFFVHIVDAHTSFQKQKFL